MGMNIGKNLVGNLSQMNKAVGTEQTGIEQKPQTIKNTNVKFPEEKPDVEKAHWGSETSFENAVMRGDVAVGDTVTYRGKEYTVVGIRYSEDGKSTIPTLRPRD